MNVSVFVPDLTLHLISPRRNRLSASDHDRMRQSGRPGSRQAGSFRESIRESWADASSARHDTLDSLTEIDWSARLPCESTAARDVLIDKKGYGGVYVQRRMVVTATHIFFCEVGSDKVIDEVALCDVVSVTQLRPVHQLASTSSPRSPFSAGSSASDELADAGVPVTASASLAQELGKTTFVRRFPSAGAAGGLADTAARAVSVTKDSLRPAPSQRRKSSAAASSAASGCSARLGKARSLNDLCEFCVTAAQQACSEGTRLVHLRADTEGDCEEWTEYLSAAARQASLAARHAQGYRRARQVMRDTYEHDYAQMAVALLIFSSFLFNVLEVQLDPAQEDAELTQVFNDADLAFTILFTVELAINMAVHWFRDFWKLSWNVFDFVIVGVSLVSLFAKNMGSATAIRSLRLFRAFRVLRIFGRLKEIRSIMSGIACSLMPVSNAFAIVALVMCVYAIVGVQLFHTQQHDAFGNFAKAIYTIFAASTMDGWQELVVMPFISDDDLAYSETVPQSALLIFFFVSFFLIVVWTLLPVVVAILLDNFAYSTRAQQEAEVRDAQERAGYLTKIQHFLDPLLEVLGQHESEEDLTQNITSLFHNLIGDPDSAVLPLEAFASNLSKKRFRNGATIYISMEDFGALLREGKVPLDDAGCLTLEAFLGLMRRELRAYVQRQLARELLIARHQGSDATSALLLAMKDVSARLAALEAELPAGGGGGRDGSGGRHGTPEGTGGGGGGRARCGSDGLVRQVRRRKRMFVTYCIGSRLKRGRRGRCGQRWRGAGSKRT